MRRSTNAPQNPCLTQADLERVAVRKGTKSPLKICLFKQVPRRWNRCVMHLYEQKLNGFMTSCVHTHMYTHIHIYIYIYIHIQMFVQMFSYVHECIIYIYIERERDQ